MRSIKPGRGPSFMGGIMSILIGVLGVAWTVGAAAMGGGFFALFGIVFVVIAIIQAVYHLKNATRKNRYSAYDITDGAEESDPLNKRFGKRDDEDEVNIYRTVSTSEFCPYCGTPVEGEYQYCNKCGKKLP